MGFPHTHSQLLHAGKSFAMVLLDMRLNYKRSTQVIVNNIPVQVQYCFTKDEISGQKSGSNKVWMVLKFQHPEKKETIRLRIAEPETMLDAGYSEIENFIEQEVACYVNHCNEDDEFTARKKNLN